MLRAQLNRQILQKVRHRTVLREHARPNKRSVRHSSLAYRGVWHAPGLACVCVCVCVSSAMGTHCHGCLEACEDSVDCLCEIIRLLLPCLEWAHCARTHTHTHSHTLTHTHTHTRTHTYTHTHTGQLSHSAHTYHVMSASRSAL